MLHNFHRQPLYPSLSALRTWWCIYNTNMCMQTNCYFLCKYINCLSRHFSAITVSAAASGSYMKIHRIYRIYLQATLSKQCTYLMYVAWIFFLGSPRILADHLPQSVSRLPLRQISCYSPTEKAGSLLDWEPKKSHTVIRNGCQSTLCKNILRNDILTQ